MYRAFIKCVSKASTKVIDHCTAFSCVSEAASTAGVKEKDNIKASSNISLEASQNASKDQNAGCANETTNDTNKKSAACSPALNG